MLVSKTLSAPNANPSGPNAKPNAPNAKPGAPNASQWNISPVGSPCVGAHVGHVHFMCFVLISFMLGNANPVSSGIWALLSCSNSHGEMPNLTVSSHKTIQEDQLHIWLLLDLTKMTRPFVYTSHSNLRPPRDDASGFL